MAIEIRCPESTATGETLFMALELGSTTWKVAVATTRGMRPRGHFQVNADRSARWAWSRHRTGQAPLRRSTW
jgi:hypothetical protein